jgi:hypothetical protein
MAVYEPPQAIWEKLGTASARDLRTLQIRWAYVGTHHKDLPSLAFTTCLRLLRMDWFPPSDGATDVWNFTTTPEEMVQVVAELARSDALGAQAAAATSSFAVAVRRSRIGDAQAEFLLDRAAVDPVAAALLTALASNGVGRYVVGLFAEAVRG